MGEANKMIRFTSYTTRGSSSTLPWLESNCCDYSQLVYLSMSYTLHIIRYFSTVVLVYLKIVTEYET
jgi:hypothetical protein